VFRHLNPGSKKRGRLEVPYGGLEVDRAIATSEEVGTNRDLRPAAPVKVERNSLSARPSARFSASERPASSRN
jgi:hypothetical protein